MLLIFIFSSMVVIGIQSILQIVYAAEDGETVIRRVEIWGLFYRMMVAAFVVGAVVQGLNVYICWRFRESHPRFKNIDTAGGKN
ncbi:MAG: heme transporter CcmC [Nitrosopumilus sp.]|nr:heme transporter CcmC [Nitrosopumilus sp.]